MRKIANAIINILVILSHVILLIKEIIRVGRKFNKKYTYIKFKINEVPTIREKH